MCIWCAVQGRGFEHGIWPEPRVLPPVVVGIVRSQEMGWWRDADKLSTNRGRSAVYIPLIVNGVDLTECPPLVLIRLII